MRVSIVGPSWIAVVLLALLALESSTLMPRFDGEVVSRPADSSQNHLDDVDLEANHRLARIAELDHLDGAAADLGVAEPVARVVLRGILGCGVQGESWIAPEVLGLHRSGHHPHPDFPVGEFHLNPTCPRGAIPSECGQNLVAASIEDAPHPISELSLGRSHLGPGAHVPRVNAAASTASSFDLMSPYAESSTATKRSTIPAERLRRSLSVVPSPVTIPVTSWRKLAETAAVATRGWIVDGPSVHMTRIRSASSGWSRISTPST